VSPERAPHEQINTRARTLVKNVLSILCRNSKFREKKTRQPQTQPIYHTHTHSLNARTFPSERSTTATKNNKRQNGQRTHTLEGKKKEGKVETHTPTHRCTQKGTHIHCTWNTTKKTPKHDKNRMNTSRRGNFRKKSNKPRNISQ